MKNETKAYLEARTHALFSFRRHTPKDPRTWACQTIEALHFIFIFYLFVYLVIFKVLGIAQGSA